MYPSLSSEYLGVGPKGHGCSLEGPLGGLRVPLGPITISVVRKDFVWALWLTPVILASRRLRHVCGLARAISKALSQKRKK